MAGPARHFSLTAMSHPLAPPLALFISDLHLQPAQPAITAAFHRFMEQQAPHAQQLYLLGDIFEYWAGDDDLQDAYHQDIIAAIRKISDAGIAVYWIAGNRDFLAGDAFAAAAGLTLLPETWVAEIGGQRIVLLHGDAQCTDDVKYMAFRAQVRQPAWQQQFLAMPLAQRKAIIAGLRENSQKEHTTKSYEVMDVTPQAIAAVFEQTGTVTTRVLTVEEQRRRNEVEYFQKCMQEKGYSAKR